MPPDALMGPPGAGGGRPLLPAPAAAAAQPAGAAAEQQGKERAVAVQFTSILLSMVVREMWNTVTVDGSAAGGPFGDGPGADVYRGIAEQAFADALARNGMNSLATEVERFIHRAQQRGAAEDQT